MSKTLFWYIFWNLLRIFLMTTASLAGIMSFAVLLSRVTEVGLDFGQVNRLMLYILPAMCTYSLPVAALFATTMVYGRFSADNELTAMRAGGISYLSPRRFSVALPAVVLGLLVAFISLVMLSFVVPVYTLKVEEVIYSNIAKVIANKIERTHAIEFHSSAGGNSFNVYADSATIYPPDPQHPALQRVELSGPAMMTYESPDITQPLLRIPKEFWMAKAALISIDRKSASDPAMLTVDLHDGIRFPRQFSGNVQVGVGSTGFGPIEIPSLINENVKFLNITRLAELAQNPGQSQKVQVVIRDLINREQQQTYLAIVASAMTHKTADGTSDFIFANDSPDSDAFQIGGTDVQLAWKGNEIILTAPGDKDARTIWMMETHGSQRTLFANAKEMHIRAVPATPIDAASDAPQRMAVSVDLFNVALTTQNGQGAPRGSFSRSFSVPMPPQIVHVGHKTLADFMHDPVEGPNHPWTENAWMLTRGDNFGLRHEQVVANNAARSELHGRASFAISCLSLVMVGCALGVMLKSGNFLNAFAASFVPALLCITLIICGQQAATHVPVDLTFVIHDPLHMALWFIWIGNISVLIAAIYLTVRLQKR